MVKAPLFVLPQLYQFTMAIKKAFKKVFRKELNAFLFIAVCDDGHHIETMAFGMSRETMDDFLKGALENHRQSTELHYAQPPTERPQ